MVLPKWIICIDGTALKRSLPPIILVIDMGNSEGLLEDNLFQIKNEVYFDI